MIETVHDWQLSLEPCGKKMAANQTSEGQGAFCLSSGCISSFPAFLENSSLDIEKVPC